MTEKQRLIFYYICNYQYENDTFPTQREIANYFNIKQPTVKEHIDYLCEKGYLYKTNTNKIRFTDKGFKIKIQTQINK